MAGTHFGGGIHGTELDALEADMGLETESDGMPSYLQDDKDPEMEADINLPAAPSGHAAQPQVSVFWAMLNWASLSMKFGIS